MKVLKLTIAILLVFATNNVTAQTDYIKEIKGFQKELNREYKDSEESPLNPKDLKKFKKHQFFSIQESYRVEAKFTRKEKPLFFQMKTSTARIGDYDIYGVADFELNGEKFTLNIYQSHQLRNTDKYKNYLFLPFTDLTNGLSSYDGGRYIDLSIPDGDTIIIDFNKAYNPYCAYSYRYSCPIPPAENNMNAHIEAGIKKPKK